MASVILTSIFGALSAFSPNLPFLLFTRFTNMRILLNICIYNNRGMVGFGIGGAPAAFSLFLEFLPEKRRGICLVMIEVRYYFIPIDGMSEYLLPI